MLFFSVLSLDTYSSYKRQYSCVLYNQLHYGISYRNFRVLMPHFTETKHKRIKNRVYHLSFGVLSRIQLQCRSLRHRNRNLARELFFRAVLMHFFYEGLNIKITSNYSDKKNLFLIWRYFDV